jgi:hypothetical protein
MTKPDFESDPTGFVEATREEARRRKMSELDKAVERWVEA